MARETSAPAEDAGPVVRPPHDGSPLSEMLAQEPSRVTRRFLWFLLFFFCAAVAAAALLHVDVTITAPAVLQPGGKGLNVQPEIAGTVIEVRVKEGDSVRAGDVLAVLESEKAGEQLVALAEVAQKLRTAEKNLHEVIPLAREQANEQSRVLRQQIAHLTQEREHVVQKRKHEEQALKALREGYKEQVAKLDEADKRNETAVKFGEENLSFRRKSYEMFEKLARQQAVGQIETLGMRRDMLQAVADLDKALSTQREGRSDRALAARTFERDEQQHLNRLAELAQELERNSVQSRSAQLSILRLQGDIRLKELEAESAEQTARSDFELSRQKAELTRSERNRELVRDVAEGKGPVLSRLLVVAPVGGRVGTVQVRRQGEAVERGATLFTLVPEGELVAEVRIANRDVALARPGQAVKLKLDAFPYAEYGSVKGELTVVPPEAEGLDRPAESFYRATARLEAQEVGKNGSAVPLQAGMTATAEIVTERKTLLQIALTPLLEPFKD